jgi:7,8-dihydropterin-6-yl-methyl-4-(beta-D-ribofuranosyl)aminobenzene 5'-phosphate synthase
MTDREVPDALIAEHGLSMLVTISKAGHEHRVLFDAGASPNGVLENMRRLDIDPSSIEAIVCSHGHFDHTAGLDGLLRVLGPPGLLTDAIAPGSSPGCAGWQASGAVRAGG